jgi:hypothetical protein
MHQALIAMPERFRAVSIAPGQDRFAKIRGQGGEHRGPGSVKKKVVTQKHFHSKAAARDASPGGHILA